MPQNKSSVPKRGVQSIRTHTSRHQGSKGKTYEAFIRISCLEMERCRRNEERAAAMGRVDQIDRRFAEIDAEIAELLGTLPEEVAQRPAFKVSRRQGSSLPDQQNRQVKPEENPVEKAGVSCLRLRY